jgi:hypothetical protein
VLNDWSLASGPSLPILPTPPLPPMPEDEEEVLEAGPSAGATTGRGCWPRPPRLDKRSLEKRGDQTGHDGNLQSPNQQRSKNGPNKKKKKKQPGKQNKNKKNYPPRQRKWTEKAEVLQKTK